MVRRVSELPDALAETLAGRDLIVFDGTCVFCSGYYKFVLKADREQVFSFATAQSELGQKLFQALDLPTTDFETNLVMVDGVIHTHLDSFAAVMGRLPWPWKVFRVLGWLPSWIKNPVYQLIARNRFRLMGRYDSCIVPDEKARARFACGGC